MSKVALITGSTSGIGKAIAHKFAQEGVNVALNGFGDEIQIQNQMKELEKVGVKAAYFSANLMNSGECKTLIQKVHAHFGTLDILVNNAGMQYVAPLEDFPDEKWENVISLDLSSAFYTTKTALPFMREKGWGRIINIASAHGVVGSIHKAAYVAAKHGLVGLTKVTALETAVEDITCNVVCPGFVYTPLVQDQIIKKAQEENIPLEQAKTDFVCQKHPSKSFVTMEDLAELVFFLSRDCAKEIRGASYVMDGAWTAN